MVQVGPSIEPMLARLARQVPIGDEWLYEPKWDGFRCIAYRMDDEVDLRSRNRRPLGRYFPEVVTALRALEHHRVVLDGELILMREEGFDFAALMSRLHPAASRVDALAAATP